MKGKSGAAALRAKSRNAPPPDGSSRPRRPVACGMAYALNHDLVRHGLVKDEIGIGKRGDPSKAALANPASRMRVRRDEFDDGMDATLDVSSAQRRMIIDVGEDVLQLAKSARHVPNSHRPCFAENAWIVSSLTNSPREASAIDSSKDVSSSTLIGIGGRSFCWASCKTIRARVLGLWRQTADSLDGAFEELGHDRSIADSLARPQTFPPFSSACARMADKVVVGVIASGSTLTCRIEGRPEASARSYAGRNSAVSSTVSP